MAAKGLKTAILSALPGEAPAEQVTEKVSGDSIEARSTSRRIKTVDDLIAHIKADMGRYEVAASEATSWECGDGDGGVVVLHRVFVRLKPKAGPTTHEIVEGMIKAASGKIRLPATPKRRRPAAGPWQVLVVSDTHFGAYSWAQTTGGDDYDLGVAEARVADAAGRLLAVGDGYKPARRTIALLGDIFHFDTPSGTTTSGTPLERDGRLQKVVNVACDVILGVVGRSSKTAPTDVIVVNGNHDEVLTWAMQRILVERFAKQGVHIHRQFTGRQYLSDGKNLLGFTHGHKAKAKLPQIMALECPQEWSKSLYREWHTGHLHHQAAANNKPLDTLSGVIVRTAPTVCPPDDWHAANGFIGARQCMETFMYRPEGGLSAMHIAGVRE